MIIKWSTYIACSKSVDDVRHIHFKIDQKMNNLQSLEIENGSPMYKIEVSKHFCTTTSWFMIIFYNCIGILYFRGKLHVTSQQIYISNRLLNSRGDQNFFQGRRGTVEDFVNLLLQDLGKKGLWSQNQI